MKMVFTLLAAMVCYYIIALAAVTSLAGRQQVTGICRPVCDCKPPCPCDPCQCAAKCCCDVVQHKRPPIVEDKQTAEPPLAWAGAYWVRGEEADKSYTGLATIHKIESNVYHVVIQIGPNGLVSRGVGQVVGGKLAVGWLVSEGAVRGCTVYVCTEKGLVGTWVSWPGNGEVNSETLIPIKPPE